MNDIRNHHRINDILLGPLERPALKWLAARMPAWMTPDMLTGIGFLGTLLTAGGYLLTGYHLGFLWLASLGYIVNWFGDSLDGTVARHRHIERPRYGFYIDHTIDAFSEVLIVLALGLSSLARFDVACIALIGYLLLSNLVFIVTCTTGEFRLSYGKLGPTEVRLLLILANTIAFFSGNPQFSLPWFTFSFYDAFISGIAFLLYFFAAQSTLTNIGKIATLDLQK